MDGGGNIGAVTGATADRFVDRLAGHDGRPALLDDRGGVTSYGALARKVAAFAARLGPERGLVVVEAALDLPTIVAYLGALAGRHAVLLSPPGEAAAALAARFGARWLVTAQGRLLRRAGAVRPHADLAVLLSTSGSTGSPKLVRLSTGNIESNAAAIAETLALRPDDRGALTLPLHYSYGLSVLNSHLAVGASLYLCDRPITDGRFLAGVARAGCTNLSGVPLSYALFERIGLRQHAWPALRFMTAAGGRLDPALIRLYARFLAARGGRFYAMYGQTEATARIAVLPPEAALAGVAAIGQAVPGGALSLVDAAGREIAGPGRRGELVYRGPNVMMGYAETPEDLARGALLDRLATGDLAERDEAGWFRICGRKSRFSKLAGLRIDHDRVEQRLAEAGFEAAVTGDDCALTVAVAGRAPPDRMRDAALRASGLSPGQLRLMPVEALPRLASGKVDYGRLRDQAAAERRPAAARTVADAFARVFAPRRVVPSDSFLTLGGDSVAHIELSLDLEDLLGSLPAQWERRTIAELAAARGRRARSRRRAVDSATVTRVGAILLVMLHHATQWPLPGGAAILMLLVGHSLGRFQFGALAAGRPAAIARPALRNIALYYLVLIPLMAAERRLDWPSLLLLGNSGWGDPARVDTIFVSFWFVEAYAQLVLLVLALFALPGLRRAVARRPFAAGLIALGASLALRAAAPLVVDYGPLAPMATPMVLHLAAFGWCLAFADSGPRKRLMLALAVLIFPATPVLEGAQWLGLWLKPAIVLAAVLLLLGPATLSLPAPAARAVTRLAAASYVVYLVHGLPAYVLLPLLPALPTPLQMAGMFAGGLAFGLLCHGLIRRLGSGRAPRAEKPAIAPG